MPIKAFDKLCCPIDGERLVLDAVSNAWRCGNGHSFDVAKQGYLNLLPVQHKRSKDPGDSKAMVAARRDFLESGFYQKLAQAISTQVAAQTELLQSSSAELHAQNMAGKEASDEPVSILDAGCGEGYYLRHLIAHDATANLRLVALDISKWAVLAAAKQGLKTHYTENNTPKNSNLPNAQAPLVQWIVASNAQIPVADASIDILLCIFGFPVYQEFHRVLKPNGVVLMVDPGADHLRELREVIYTTLKPENQAKSYPEYFTAEPAMAVRYPVTLRSQQEIANLLAMTPHLFRAPQEGKQRVQALERLKVSVDVQLQVLRKN
ncbi:rRNA (guanine-N1)-methyltransferase [Aliidiomarina iranensis]|uniref:rRNA (Guanine-N1)-methyltransferase n=1 Tax=Aliidiomarina iranensis TaxID=1434071 RepID=A0A432W1Z2_9GAMM|nr:methyltransferase domain-containing protein [Aliidiomarina iranensis]RUO23237.1 rRNA (guanine-N1)-methyltransferase [Aliidiomarina iranensis]